jgi:hypothetical protein
MAITVVDGVPLPYGEEFTGVIRVQDVRATEKDKVKIGDCFRGGDVVKGVVVRLSQLHREFQLFIQIIAFSRRFAQLLYHDCKKRSRRYFCHKRGRSDNGTRLLARNAVSYDRKIRKAEMRETR